MDSQIFSAATVAGTAVFSSNCAVVSLPNFKRLVFLGLTDKTRELSWMSSAVSSVPHIISDCGLLDVYMLPENKTCTLT